MVTVCVCVRACVVTVCVCVCVCVCGHCVCVCVSLCVCVCVCVVTGCMCAWLLCMHVCVCVCACVVTGCVCAWSRGVRVRGHGVCVCVVTGCVCVVTGCVCEGTKGGGGSGGAVTEHWRCISMRTHGLSRPRRYQRHTRVGVPTWDTANAEIKVLSAGNLGLTGMLPKVSFPI